MRFAFLFLSIFLGSFFISNALAEDRASGRLPDGRAYRTDRQGYRLVDHVAELEVEADDLRKQLHALENELAEKNQIIERGNLAAHAPERVRVETIIKEVPKEVQVIKEVPVVREREVIKEVVREVPVIKEVKVTEQVKDTECINNSRRLENEIAACLNDLRKNADQVASLKLKNENASTEFLAEKKKLQQEKTRDLAELDAKVKTSSSGASELTKQLAAIRVELQNTNEELVSALSEKSRIEKELASQTGAVIALEQQLNQTTGDLKLARGRLTEVATAKTEEKIIPASNSNLNYKSSKIEKVEAEIAPTGIPITGGGKSLTSRLTKIDSLISERKSIFDRLRAQMPQIAISMQQLKTKKGASLDSLRAEIRSGGVDEDFVGHELGDIELTLYDDIKTAKRLLKIQE